MRRHSLEPIFLVAVTTLLAGCATAGKAPSVLGRSVIVVPQADGPKIRGELLAVSEDRLIVRADEGVRELTIPQIREVRVRRHSVDRKAWTWTLVGAVVSTVALAAACGSVEDSGNCAGAGLLFGAAPWLLVGGLSAMSLENSAFLSIDAHAGDKLSAFARYPQGLPTGFDLRGFEKQSAPQP